MASIDKLISKINKAKSAINSFKGIASKFSSKNFTSALDKLGERAEEAKRSLEKRRSSLEQSVASNRTKNLSKSPPPLDYMELRYPLEEVDNYITFQTRLRRKREGENAANIFGDTGVEIMLYVPDGLTSSSEVSYTGKNVGTMARAIQDIREEEGLPDTFNETTGQIGKIFERRLQAMGNKLTAGVGNINDGRAKNPMQEQMLEGVTFRSFSFDYEFWPKSAEEAEMANDIIYTFRTAMLPDTFGGKDGDAGVENYFNFPNVFDVEFEGPIRQVLDGFLPMVCTKCDVDHFNGQKFATFTDGQPVSTKMTLEFLEIKILSQENYQQISPLGNKSITGMDSLRDNATNDNELRNQGLSNDDIAKRRGRTRTPASGGRG
jgi:hypothetical protein